MATPRIQGYTSQKNYDYYQEAYTAYMAKEKNKQGVKMNIEGQKND
ncbi:hypothetical protein [Streptococcus suis]|nr:hypothetical protein [Streptococcus suis]